MSVNNRRTFRRSGVFQDIYSRDRGQNEDIGGLQVGDRSTKWIEIGATGAPAFQSAWVNYGTANWATAAFMRDAAGIVHIKGLIKNGTFSSPLFTLPVGFRPLQNMIFAGIQGDNSAIRIDVYDSGIIQVSAGVNNSHLALNVIQFPAEA